MKPHKWGFIVLSTTLNIYVFALKLIKLFNLIKIMYNVKGDLNVCR